MFKMFIFLLTFIPNTVFAIINATPSETISSFYTAIQKRDGKTMEEMVDYNSVANGILDDAEQIVRTKKKEEIKALEKYSSLLVEYLNKGDLGAAKTLCKQLALYDLRRYFGTAFGGDLLDKVSPDKGFLLPHIKKLEKRNDIKFKGVKNIREKGNLANLTLVLNIQKYKYEAPFILRLEKSNNTWKIKKIVNFKAIVAQIDKYEHAKKK